ncbi:hypothetical protein F5Y07DRAFT_309686 [Xylaria sp. FL0933]|nr:hypothetical protein F5Y07DRAFT_309686 [Xylaria sp. FL0933]
MEGISDDSLDIVATQGKHLIPRRGTPVLLRGSEKDFVTTLTRKLESLVISLEDRRKRYHEIADDSPMGHTPPEVKERYAAELEAMDEWWGLSDDAYEAYWAARGEENTYGKQDWSWFYEAEAEFLEKQRRLEESVRSRKRRRRAPSEFYEEDQYQKCDVSSPLTADVREEEDSQRIRKRPAVKLDDEADDEWEEHCWKTATTTDRTRRK